ncbi:MAG: hypothetical protein J6X89_05325 [Bacteroidales bacterium]|nr:hypothetical protein [Bacteroidales bacterium]
MRFADIYGNDAIKARLTKMVDENRLGHALLLVEQEGTGAIAFAIALSQYLNCKHRSGGDSCGECSSCQRHAKFTYPDIHFVFPVNSSPKLSEQEKKRPISAYFMRDFAQLVTENPYFDSREFTDALGIENKAGAITVNEAREIADTLSLQPYESDYKIMVIWQPEKMTTDAANKLLKLLEEPPAGTLFLMVTQSAEKMLPTVLSRCQIIHLQPVERDGAVDEHSDQLLRDLLEASLSKSLTDVLDAADAISSLGKDKQRQWCIYAEGFIRKMYMISRGLEGISFARQEEKDYIATLVPRIKEPFYGKAAAALDAAIRMIESNVSAKLVFADLGNRFYLYI